MQRSWRLVFPFLVGLICVASVQSDDLMTARVISVTDGDNLTVLDHDNKQVLIRLHGLDCPELEQPFGEQAKAFTSDQCFGKIIMYRMVGLDKFDRTIAVVYLEDGRELNLELLKAGLAWHLKHYLDRPEYAEAEKEARAAGIGLWGEKDPTPPWEWRKNQRHKQN
jgi:micrococcal nuclease